MRLIHTLFELVVIFIHVLIYIFNSQKVVLCINWWRSSLPPPPNPPDIYALFCLQIMSYVSITYLNFSLGQLWCAFKPF